MKRQEFTGILIGVLVKKIPMWLPEEAPEVEMLDIMQKEMDNHNKLIQDALIRNGDDMPRRRYDD